ncbi:arginine decarboxylase, pyruvoyl-dependent [Candidatus Micrarchaeota archaeon]|nr:arginine decarboxylase, pyruvoyl-dependent [Candidatus Micrarchaeota archaeon]MBD3417930.1 arginine decarboxylase, pyruvoyl-dependent [Candidatus Micrarchaeota archaeon]
MVPKRVFLTKGVGKSNTELGSFEEALRDAGIAYCNLVYVSSIFPPGAKLIKKTDGIKKLDPGQIVFCVMSRISSCEPSRRIAASIGLALPKNRGWHGYVSEHHSYGQNKQEAGDYAEDLAASMLASTLGIEFDADAAWNAKEEYFRMSGKIVKTTNSTATAEVDKRGNWTTAIATAVLLP